MEFEYFGGNCIKLTTKKSSLMIDLQDLEKIGAKPVTKYPEISLYSEGKPQEIDKANFLFYTPGEYEVHNISIRGIAAQGTQEESDAKNNVIYRLITNDIRVAFAGNVNPDLDNEQLETIGTIDILFVPVGGGGVTLDSVGALKMIRNIEPKIVVPTYYADKGLKYQTPLMSLEDALKELAMEPSESLDKLKIKNRELVESTRLIVLKRQ